jgi:HAD superfamily hydrolase (TIGR01490 family)
LRHAVPFGLVAAGRADRDLVKERFIAHTLTGYEEQRIHEIGAAYAADLLQTRLFPQMRQRVEWHRDQGHQLVMVSATLDVYLTPLAERFGFDELICTRLEIVDGKATGKLVGVNVRAAEKSRRLLELLDGSEPTIWAYGNSRGDHEMLAMAGHPFYVDRKGNFTPYRAS